MNEPEKIIDLTKLSGEELCELQGQQYEELFKIQNNLRNIKAIIEKRKQDKDTAKKD